MKFVRYWFSWEEAIDNFEVLLPNEYHSEESEYFQGLKQELERLHVIPSGQEHQDTFGVPVFEDDKVILASKRVWGELMSKIFGGDFMDYYS